MKKLIILLIMSAFCVQSIAQINIVNDYSAHLNNWLADTDNNIEDRIYIDEKIFYNDRYVTKINNNLSQKLAEAKRIPYTEQIGLINEQFLNEIGTLEKARLQYSQLEYCNNVSVPQINGLIFNPTFVKASYNFRSKTINCSGSDVLIVWQGKIIQIMDYNSSMIRGLECYKAKKYDDSYRILRKQAINNPKDYQSQYYVTIMTLRNKGCSNYDKKTRKKDAAWWMVNAQKKKDKDMFRYMLAELAIRFEADKNITNYHTPR